MVIDLLPQCALHWCELLQHCCTVFVPVCSPRARMEFLTSEEAAAVSGVETHCRKKLLSFSSRLDELSGWQPQVAGTLNSIALWSVSPQTVALPPSSSSSSRFVDFIFVSFCLDVCLHHVQTWYQSPRNWSYLGLGAASWELGAEPRPSVQTSHVLNSWDMPPASSPSGFEIKLSSWFSKSWLHLLIWS